MERLLSCHGRYRYVIFLLGCLANVVSYADRTNISLAIVPMREALDLDDSAEGACLAAFFAGYACTQIVGGWLALRYGPKQVLCAAIALCSVATLSTPAAAGFSFELLICSRVALGIAEGCLLPALHALAIAWSPPRERTTAAALQTSGQLLSCGRACTCMHMHTHTHTHTLTHGMHACMRRHTLMRTRDALHAHAHNRRKHACAACRLAPRLLPGMHVLMHAWTCMHP